MGQSHCVQLHKDVARMNERIVLQCIILVQEHCPAHMGPAPHTTREVDDGDRLAMDTKQLCWARTGAQGLRRLLLCIMKTMLQTGTIQTCRMCCCFDRSQTGAPCIHFPARHTRSLTQAHTVWQPTCGTMMGQQSSGQHMGTHA